MAVSFEKYSHNLDVVPDFQTLKGWYGLSLTIGIVIIGIGIFGLIGLLQAHGYLTLPQKVIAIIKDIDPTSPYLALWSMLFGGGSVGGMIIAISASGLKKIKWEEQWEPFLEKYFFPLSETSFNKNDFRNLQPITYCCLRNKKKNNAFKIVLRTAHAKLYASKALSKIDTDQCMRQLNDFSYQDSRSLLIDHFEQLSLDVINFLDIPTQCLAKLPNNSLISLAETRKLHRILIKDGDGKILVSRPIPVKDLQKCKSFLNPFNEYQEVAFSIAESICDQRR